MTSRQITVTKVTDAVITKEHCHGYHKNILSLSTWAQKLYYSGTKHPYVGAVLHNGPARPCIEPLFPCIRHQLPGNIRAYEHDFPA